MVTEDDVDLGDEAMLVVIAEDPAEVRSAPESLHRRCMNVYIEGA